MRYDLCIEKIKRVWEVKYFNGRPVLGYKTLNNGKKKLLSINSKELTSEFIFNNATYRVRDFSLKNFSTDSQIVFVSKLNKETGNYESCLVEDLNKEEAEKQFEIENKKYSNFKVDSNPVYKKFYETFNINKEAISPDELKVLIKSFLEE